MKRDSGNLEEHACRQRNHRHHRQRRLNEVSVVGPTDDFHQERKVRAVILTGAGTAFCAGMDLVEMQETSQQPDALLQWHNDAVQYRELLDKMLQFPKPIIAAVNGPVVAGGAGLTLASDIVIAADSVKFALPEPRL